MGDDSWKDHLNPSNVDPWTDDLGYTNLEEELFTTELKEEAKAILLTLHEEHPEIFEEWEMTPEEYGRIVRLAVASYDGTEKSTGGIESEQRVEQDFLAAAEAAGYLTYQEGSYQQIDFEGTFTNLSETFLMDAKGGEGNSLTTADFSIDKDRSIVWSELTTGRDIKPSSRLSKIISRVVKDALDEDEHTISYIVLRDHVAGPGTTYNSDDAPYPDIVVLPEQLPMSPGEHRKAELTDENKAFIKMVFDVLCGIDDITSEIVQKRIWLHDLHYRDPDEHANPVKKNLYNYYRNDLTITTSSIARYRSGNGD
ncbi:hypothetical protein [Halomicrococcus sp. SG-WS-1]|uniref:hypothetical protein n=1 Tax=Halomicrococcus sp. SG-WS-1 TaxID=3439057 RepID=UPI003F7A1F2F